MRMRDKTMIVTGGASGIGLATVERCLREGARLVIADLPNSGGEKRASELGGSDERCLFIGCDVTSTEQVDHLFARTVDRFGRVDAVFNNAGIGGITPADQLGDDDYLRIIDINLNGVFRVARAALRQMYKQGSGSLINCGSILSALGQSGTAAYSAAKGGVVNLTRTLAIEAAPKGVRVNTVGPGYIDTPLLKDLPDEMRKALIALHPIGRLGRDEEVANAVLFLASEEASFVTGAYLLVDGGFAAGKS